MYKVFVSYVKNGEYGNMIVTMSKKLETAEEIAGLQSHLGGVIIISWQQIGYIRGKNGEK